VGQQVIRHILDFPQGGHGAFEVAGVPKDDCGDEQIEAGRAVLLVLVGAVSDFTQAMEEDGTRQAVAGLSLVEFLAGGAAQFGIFDPVQGEERALQAPQLAQCRGDAVLPRIGGELAHDDGSGHGASAERRDDAQDL
jgi:hypothetical protein